MYYSGDSYHDIQLNNTINQDQANLTNFLVQNGDTLSKSPIKADGSNLNSFQLGTVLGFSVGSPNGFMDVSCDVTVGKAVAND